MAKRGVGQVATRIPLPPLDDGVEAVMFSKREPDRELVELIQKTCNGAEGFAANFPVSNSLMKKGMKDQIPHEFRPARCFLHQLGRTHPARVVKQAGLYPDKTPKQPVYEVKLQEDLQSLPDDDVVVVSAKTIESSVKDNWGPEVLEKLKSNQELPGYIGRAEKRGLDVNSLEKLFGPKEFKLTMKEVKTLQQSASIRLGYHLPSKFFAEFTQILSDTTEKQAYATGAPNPKTAVQFYYEKKGLPLENIKNEYPDCELSHLLANIIKQPAAYGFSSAEHVAELLQLSITELGNEACVSQEGYFMVGNGNQIASKEGKSIHFVSAIAIDFQDERVAFRELKKYLNDSEWTTDGEARLRSRMKGTYDIVFTTCKSMGVTHPTLLGMGLGNFLKNVPESRQQDWWRIYHEVQFELLSEKDYGFKCVFLNPGPPRVVAEAKKVLENTGYSMLCPFVFHNRDGKALAIQISRYAKTSFLIPSDPISVLQGCMGHRWEAGYDQQYFGEEDFGATSTGVLATATISPIIHDPDNMFYHPEDVRSMSGSNGTMVGCPPGEIEPEEEYVKHCDYAFPKFLNSLTESFLRHQPMAENLEAFTMNWAIDQMLVKWQAAFDKAQGQDEEGQDRSTGGTIKPHLSGQFNDLVDKLKLHWEREIGFDEYDRKMRLAKERQKEQQDQKVNHQEAQELVRSFKKSALSWAIEISSWKEGIDPPLVWSIINGHSEVAKELIKKKAPLDTEWLGGNTPLHNAILENMADVVNELLKPEYNTPVNRKNFNQETPLHLAIAKGNAGVADLLIKHKDTDLDIPNSKQTTPLHAALRKGMSATAKKMVERSFRPASLVRIDHQRNTPLILACQAGQSEFGLVLLELYNKDKTLFAVDAVNGDSLDALHYSLKNRLEPLVIMLTKVMELKKLSTRRDNKGESHLHWAFRYGHPETVKLLSDNGYDLNLKNDEGLTPKDLVTKYDKLSLDSYFREKDRELNKEPGATSLHFASVDGDLARLKTEIEVRHQGKCVNAQTNTGLTPLHCALHSNFPSVAVYLLSQGAAVTPKEILAHGSEQLKQALRGITVTPSELEEKRRREERRAKRLREQMSLIKIQSMPKSNRERDRVEKLLQERAGINEVFNIGTRMDDGVNYQQKDPSKRDQPLWKPDWKPGMDLERWFEQHCPLPNDPGFQTVLAEAKLFTALKLEEEEKTRKEMQVKGKPYTPLDRNSILAIYVYSYECPVYRYLNKAVREREYETVERWRAFIWYLDLALRKIPSSSENRNNTVKVFRGISVAVDKNIYKVGNIVCWDSFSSSSSDQMVAESFLGANNSHATIFIITTKIAKSIQKYSCYPEEAEVLFPPGSTFRVMNVLTSDTAQLLHLSTMIIELEEVDKELAKNAVAG